MLKRFFLALVVLSPIFLQAQLVARTLKAANGQTIGFYEFTPSDYTKTGVKHPLIIFLHGVSERGNGTTELTFITKVGIPKYIKNGSTMRFYVDGKWQSFVVLMPQLSKNYGGWQTFYTDEMINYATKNLNVDPNRIFLTGLSLGGGGVWSYASSSLANASKLAGIVPVCGTCGMSNAGNLVNGGVAVWAFHGDADTRVSAACSKNAINAIKALNPKKDALLTLYSTTSHVIWDRAYDFEHKYQTPNVWEWMLRQSRTSTTTTNKPPVANAGSDKTITLPTNQVTLSGSATDADGTISSYSWSKVSGPSTFTIATPTSKSTVVSGLVAGTYVFRLTAKDNSGNADYDDVTVIVKAAANSAPVADAGKNQKVEGSSTTLDGSASKDPDGKITKVEWTQLQGPSTVSFGSPSALKTTVSGMKNPGTYVFRLRVYDEQGARGQDDVSVAVIAASASDPEPEPDPENNQAPVADAGKNQKVQSASTTLDGSASKDPDGKITKIEWTQLQGPSTVSFGSPGSIKTTVSGMNKPGLYVFRLRVYDEFGARGQDDIGVTVESSTAAAPEPDPEPSDVPVSYAGKNQTISGTSATLDGTGSTGKIAKYEWVMINGPSQYKITSPGSAKTTVTGLVPGFYIFRLFTYNSNGDYTRDDMGLTVNGTASMAALSAPEAEVMSTSSTPQVIPQATTKIYPNPATSVINIQFNSVEKGTGFITVYDISGKSVKKISINKQIDLYQHTLDVSELTKGIYYIDVNLNNKKGSLTQFVKQ